MSGATFSAPASGTTGLQGYDLKRPAIQLYPSPETDEILRRLRESAARRRKSAASGQNGAMRKDSATMTDTIKSMVGTLSKSVTEIVNADTPDRAALLEKTFSEFRDAVSGQVQQEVDQAVGQLSEELGDALPLYKGMGCVGRVADLCRYIAKQVALIQEGKEWEGQPEENACDPASDEVSDMLDSLVSMSELVLRQTVNEHVELPDDDEVDEDGNGTDALEEGTRLVVVPSAEEDGQQVAVVVKTHLPEELAKFATDPAYISSGMMEIGARHLALAGVPETALNKFFSGDLAKAAGDADAGGEGMTMDPPVDAGDDGEEAEVDEDMSPLEALGRLAAGIMLIVDQLQQAVQGGEPEDEEAAEEAPAAEETPAEEAPAAEETPAEEAPAEEAPAEEAPAEEAPAEEEDEEANKGADKPHIAHLKKTISDLNSKLEKATDNHPEVQRLQKQVTILRDQLRKISAQPAMAKAVVGAGSAISMTKAADTGGTNNLEDRVKEEADRLSKMSPENRAVELIKMVQRNGGEPMLKKRVEEELANRAKTVA